MPNTWPGRARAAPQLERIEVVIEPEDVPGRGRQDKVLIGEDVSKRLDVTPTRFRVIVTRRPKYAYRGEDDVIQALARLWLGVTTVWLQPSSRARHGVS